MDHYFHVSNGGNVDIIIERLIDVTCKDSKFTCDTDEFSTSKGSLCQKCVEYFCKRIDSLTCAHRCPYYRKPAADSQIRINSATNNSNLERSADHKTVALTVVFILGVIVAPLTVLLIYKTFDDRQTVIHHDIEMVDLSQRNTNQESRDLEENRVLIPDSSPQLGPSGATGGHQEQGPTDEEMVDQPDLSPRNTSEESRNLEENRVLIPDSSPQQGPSGATRGHPEPRPLDEEPLLKNGRELEINIIAFDDPSFRDIQEGKRAVVIRPANSED